MKKVDIRQENHESQMQQGRQKSSKRIQEIINKQLSEEVLEQETDSGSVLSDSEVDYMV